MKNLFTATTALVFVVLICGVAFLGCEGEEGPTGADGADGNGSCGSCHNVTTSVLAKQMQWEESGHATGTAAAYAGGRSSCTMCHSSEGFTDKLAGNEAVNRTDVTPVNCRTCHNIHTNYDSTDYALATTAPVELTGTMYTGAVIDIGKGNLCANCHQTRARSYEENGLVVDGTDMVDINSSHWGPHYGTHSNYLTGNGGFEVPGSLQYTNSYHTTGVEDGCVTCHLHNDNHTFEPDEDACAVCHADIDGIDEFRGVQDDISALMTELETALLADSLLAGEPGDTHPNNGVTRSANKAGALLNFLGMRSDGSLGIHNTKYQRAMLQNSIEVFE